MSWLQIPRGGYWLDVGCGTVSHTDVASASLRGLLWGIDGVALILMSALKVMPAWVRGAGAMAAVLFSIVAVRLYLGHALTPLSEPLPFYGYPFLVVTLLGWAWAHYRAMV